MMREFSKLVVLQVLRAYKWAISPMFPPACRYVPTCSDYAMEAIDRYGVLRGGFMALTRLLRCHPFVRGGYDPVKSPLLPKTGRNEAPSVHGLTVADESLTTHDRAWRGNF